MRLRDSVPYILSDVAAHYEEGAPTRRLKKAVGERPPPSLGTSPDGRDAVVNLGFAGLFRCDLCLPGINGRL